MPLSSIMRECLFSLDLERAKRIWNNFLPDKPPITSDAEMLATLHLARTMARSIPDKLRFYSHRWLTERGLPSLLPDELRPDAEQMYPVLRRSVGISLNSQSSMIAPAIPIIRGAMEGAVLEAYDDGRGDDIPFVKERMAEAKSGAIKKLFGKLWSRNG